MLRRMQSGSDMLSQHSPRPRVDLDRPQFPIVDVLQGHGHDLRLAVDIDAAEELQPKTGAKIFALLRAAALLEFRRGAKGIVELARAPCSRMQRTGDEFPERLEVAKHRAVRIVVMR